MATTADLVAAARSMLTGWEYRLGAHGQLDTATGLQETDCQYLVDRCCQAVGIAGSLGPVLPWEVPYMVAHTSFPRVSPATAGRPGLIAVFANPALAGQGDYYAHTGIVTGPDMYVSAYDPQLGVIESRISDTPLTLAFYLDTQLPADSAREDDSDMDVRGTMTLLTASGLPAGSLTDVSPLTRILDGGGNMYQVTSATYPVFGLAVAGVPGHAGPAYLTIVNGQTRFILARNVSTSLT